MEWVAGVAYDVMRGKSGGRPFEWIAPGTINLEVVDFSDNVTRLRPSKAWSNPYAEPSQALERHAMRGHEKLRRQQWVNGRRVA